MRTTSRLAAYAAAVAVLAAGAYAAGSAVGPLDTAVRAAPAAHEPAGAAPGPAAAEPAALPGGLASSSGGYTLSATDPTLPTSVPAPFAFRITGPDGTPVTAFDVAHEKRMHLVVVRRDGTAFQHVHPEMAADGTWTVPLAAPAAGSYRAFADFVPTGGEPTTLGVDLSAAGPFAPVQPAESRTAQVDGYTVELAGDLVPGRPSAVTATVRRDGLPVADLQPYLGAYGHLVALRQGDLAYLHVHPDGEPGDGATPPGPEVGFVVEVPSAGTYRLFLDFRHGDAVRTAEFTVTTTGAAPAAPDAPPAHSDAPGATPHGH